MMNIKPGDEVVCVDEIGETECLSFWRRLFYRCPVRQGQTYTVTAVTPVRAYIGIRLQGVANATKNHWWNAQHFRKVQRRDLSVWLATKNTIEDPKRLPAEERV